MNIHNNTRSPIQLKGYKLKDNATGDKARLIKPSGSHLDSCSWKKTSKSHTSCH